MLVVGIAIAIGTAHGSRHAPTSSATSTRSTSTAPSTTAPAAAPPPTSLAPVGSPSPAAPSVRWYGAVTWNGPDVHRDLDAVPVRTDAAGGDLAGSTFETTLSADSGAQLYVMTGSPGYQQCRDAVAANGTDETKSLHAGDVVCVLTSEGRVARVRVRTAAIGFPAATIRADVTVWDPPLPR